jgi:hypothetical protein
MSRALWSSAYILFLIATVSAPIVAIRAGLRRIRSGRIGRLKGFLLYGLAALSPTVVYVALFFALVGIEELTGAALIAEEVGRSFLIVIGFGLLVWLLALIPFTVLVARVKSSEGE